MPAPSPRTRVLVEQEDPQVRQAQAADLLAENFKVTTCPGPLSLPARACPLMQGYCALALGADVIVNDLRSGQLGVYVAQRAYLPDCPILLGRPQAQRARSPAVDLLAETIPANSTGAALIVAVRAAAGRAPGSRQGTMGLLPPATGSPAPGRGPGEIRTGGSR